MAHSHSKTLIASLGFADPDKESPKHFLACQYIAQRDAVYSLVRSIGATNSHRDSMVKNVELEHRIARSGNAKTTVGFADVLITHMNSWNVRFEPVRYREGDGRWLMVEANLRRDERVIDRIGEAPGRWVIEVDPAVATERIYRKTATVLVEVKVNPVGMDSVMRQIKFYQCHLNATRAVAVTLFPVSRGDVATLKAEGIDHVYLGEAFAMWCAERDNSPADSVEL